MGPEAPRVPQDPLGTTMPFGLDAVPQQSRQGLGK